MTKPSLVRSIGEIANLLNWFWRAPCEIRNWVDLPDQDRRNRFRPAAVRHELAKLNWLVPFDDHHYGRLCELFVHPTPDTKPNAHDSSTRPVVGAFFQEKGFLLSTWELCWALSVVAGPIAKLAILPRSEATDMIERTAALFERSSKYMFQ